MTDVRVKDENGAERSLAAADGAPLMEALRDAGTGIQGICGGSCMCGTCHVYVDAEWLDRLPPKSDEEQMMLEAIGEVIEVRPNSRLSCQIPVHAGLEGMHVEVGPVP